MSESLTIDDGEDEFAELNDLDPLDSSSFELCQQLLEHARFLTGSEREFLERGIEDQCIYYGRLYEIRQNHASELP